jgi:UDP-2,4-diacetamido-2,4,6-trideoxy-beta-L-altropyranose hydrolase
MKVAIRVDASHHIGTGHFMRCLTLADVLRQHNAQTLFISRHLPMHLSNLLASKGHELVLLGTVENDVNLDELAHAPWLGVSQGQDAADSIQVLSGGDWDWIVVDHYALDGRWESTVRRSAKQIMVIDDIADRQHDCDVLLDQNLYEDMQTRYTGKVPAHCQLLLGPCYALLRDEFRQLHEQIMPRRGPAKRILVFLGGVDFENYTGCVIEALSEINLSGIHVDVVIGAQHPCREQIRKECVQLGFICHVQTNNMAELMAKADLAVGSGGTASWERCCLGLPAVIVSLADNQIDIAKALDQFGACVYLGPADVASSFIMRNTLFNLLNNQALLSTLSKNSYSLVDGLGTDRLGQILRC